MSALLLQHCDNVSLTDAPRRFLFFALFSVVSKTATYATLCCLDRRRVLQVGKTSAFIGPFVSSAIITASGNNDSMPFAFLFALYVSGCLTCYHGLTAACWQGRREYGLPRARRR